MGPTLQVPFSLVATPARLDVHFSVDTTGSFGAEIDAMQRDLEGRLIPDIQARVADVAFGVSRFEDFPLAMFGDPGDRPFELLSPITTDVATVRAGVNALDRPLGQRRRRRPSRATRRCSRSPRAPGSPAKGSSGSLLIWAQASGAWAFARAPCTPSCTSRTPPPTCREDYAVAGLSTHGEAAVRSALAELPAFLLAAVGSSVARESLRDLVVDSGAVVPATGGACRTGLNGATRPAEGGQCPLIFDIATDGTGLSDVIVDAITGLVETLSFGEVSAEFDTDRLGFIESFEATSATTLPGVEPPTRVDSAPVDGVFDTFEDVRGGTELVFTLGLRNVLLTEQDYEQVFRITIRVVGDGVVLIEETLRVIVPAATPVPAGDAGP
jgi:hypothetical protein